MNMPTIHFYRGTVLLEESIFAGEDVSLEAVDEVLDGLLEEEEGDGGDGSEKDEGEEEIRGEGVGE